MEPMELCFSLKMSPFKRRETGAWTTEHEEEEEYEALSRSGRKLTSIVRRERWTLTGKRKRGGKRRGKLNRGRNEGEKLKNDEKE